MKINDNKLIDLFSDYSGRIDAAKNVSDMTPEEADKFGENERLHMLRQYNPNSNIPLKRKECERFLRAYEVMTSEQVLLSRERELDIIRNRNMKNIRDANRLSGKYNKTKIRYAKDIDKFSCGI